MEYILETKNLTKQFRKTRAVDSLNMHVKKGDIYGFIGRNGAGKTTTLKMIGGLTHQTSGDFSIFNYSGDDVRKNNVFSRIGLLIEAPGIYPDMTAYNNLRVKCICAGIKRDGYIEDLLRLVGLDNVKKKVKAFSLGMKQRLGIALALVGDPDILILDEPINGLDPQGIAEVRETILRLNKERNITIIISSHILEELTKIATTYGIIHEGKLLMELSTDELAEKCEDKIEIKLAEVKRACIELEKMGITKYKVVDDSTIQVYERLSDSAQIGMALAKADILVTSLSVVSDKLEDFYFNLTGGAHHA